MCAFYILLLTLASKFGVRLDHFATKMQEGAREASKRLRAAATHQMLFDAR